MKQATALIILLALMLPMTGCLSGAGNSSEYTSLPDHDLNASGMTSGGTGVMMAVRADEIPTSSPEAKEWFIRGLEYNAHYNQFDKALACFNNSLEIDPSFSEAWCAKGVTLHNLKRYDEALDCYDRAIELDPENAAVWSLKGTTCNERGLPEDAAECYQKAILTDPGYGMDTYNNTPNSSGRMLNNSHIPVNPAKSVMGISVKADEISTSSPKAKEWFIQGLYYTNHYNQFEEALNCLNKSLEIDQAFVEAWYVKGVALHNLQRYDEAQYCFDRAIALDPFDISVWFLKAMTFYDMVRH